MTAGAQIAGALSKRCLWMALAYVANRGSALLFLAGAFFFLDAAAAVLMGTRVGGGGDAERGARPPGARPQPRR